MREIKFRVWDPAEKQMCPVIVADFQDIKARVFCRLPKSGAQKIFSADLMQYTGVKDKNGVEIYEGDIIHWDPVHPIESYTPTYAKTKPLNDYIIQWNDARCEFWAVPRELGHAYANINQSDLSMNWKVIGNIYENPELVSDETNT